MIIACFFVEIVTSPNLEVFSLDPSELSPYIFRSDPVVLVKKKMKGR